MKLSEIFQEKLKSIQKIKQLKPKLANAAQQIYNNWAQNEEGYDEELGTGGICQDIADALADILNGRGIDSYIVDSGGMGEQHVWVVVKVQEGIFSVDIPPEVYETGGGYSWRKRPNVEISPDDIIISKLSNNPEEIDQFIEY